jgi:LCP family protein required for cell wall assembly
MQDLTTWRPSGRSVWWVAATLVGALLLTVASVAAVNAWNVDVGLKSQFQIIPDALPAVDGNTGPGGRSVPAGADAPVTTQGAAQNILVLGVDAGADAGGDASGDAGTASEAPGPAATRRGVLTLLTADTLRAAMVVHIPVDRSSVTVVAVPLSDAPSDAPSDDGRSTDPANDSIRAALAADGVAGAVRATQDLLSATIDHVAAVDLAGFPAATKALGGVTFDNPRTFTAGGRTFQAGRVHVNGAAALDWVRGPSDGDGAARVEAQQLLLQAMLTAAVRSETFTTLRTLSELARQVMPFIAVDKGLTTAYVIDLGVKLRDIRSDVVFVTLPATDAARSEFLTATFGARR